MADNWKELDKELFTEDVLQIHCDTRDFHCSFNKETRMEIKDLPTLLKYKKAFFFTIEEVFDLLTRLLKESGGPAGWRMLSFKQNGDWFKYLRIFKTDHGYVIGTSFREEHKFYRRSFWFDAEVEQEHLSTH